MKSSQKNTIPLSPFTNTHLIIIGLLVLIQILLLFVQSYSFILERVIVRTGLFLSSLSVALTVKYFLYKKNIAKSSFQDTRAFLALSGIAILFFVYFLCVSFFLGGVTD